MLGPDLTRTAQPKLAADCDTLLGLRYTLSRPDTLNWGDATATLTSGDGWDGVTVEGTPKRVTKLELAPYAFRGALTRLATLDALVELKLTVHTTRDTTETPDTGTTGITPQTTLQANPPTCSDKALGGRGQRAANPQLAADCDTLLAIKSTLAQKDPNAPGDPATRPDPLGIWGHDTALSDWGNTVTVSGTPKRVTELRLQSLGLKGIIPTQIGDLTALEILDLRDNQLTGAIPTQIEKLTALTKLHLRDNQLTGSIPTQVGRLTALTFLNLRGNQLDGSIPTQVENLASLTNVNLSFNRLTGNIPTQFGDLAALERISLGSNSLTGGIPTQLGSLASLRELHLPWNQLTGSIPTQLGNLANLTYLRLRHNQLSGSIPPLPGLIGIEKAYINGNRFTGCTPASLLRAEFNEGGVTNPATLGLPAACPTASTPTP